LLNNINREDLEIVANKLHFLITQSRLDNQQISLSVTVSLGATLVTKEDTTETIVDRVDQLMYESKNAGRNCLTIG